MGMKIFSVAFIALCVAIAGCAKTQYNNTAVLPDEKPTIIIKKTALEPIKISTYQYVQTLGYMEEEDLDKNPDTVLFTSSMESSQDQLPLYKYQSKIWVKFSPIKDNGTQIELSNYSDQFFIRKKTDYDIRKIADFIGNQP